MHVTWSKLTLKFTVYCRQTSYTDSTVIHTLVPAVAWELQSQFAPGYMHFNIIFLRCLWEDMNISQWKNGDRTFFSLEVDDQLLLASRRFQPGEGPSRGLLRDCTNSPINRFAALLGTPDHVMSCSAASC